MATKNQTFVESTSRSQTQTLTIPNLKSVSSVTVNTGSVAFEISGETITFTLNNGAISRTVQTGGSYTPANTIYVTAQPSSYYNSGGYTGTLTQYLESGTYTPSTGEKKTETVMLVSADPSDLRDTWYYQDNEYAGTLPAIGPVTQASHQWKRDYSGTVTKKPVDTRVYRYQGNVSRLASDTRTYQSYYQYTVTVNFVDNTAPTLILATSSNQTITENQSILLTDKNDFILKITPNDTNTSDTLQYSVLLRSTTVVPYTTCTKGTVIDYTIPFASLLLGNNTVQVKVKDNNGAETVRNLVLRLKAPVSLSQKSVKDALTAMGYPNTSFGCLKDLKPSSYPYTTLSLAEIINSLS